MDNNTYIKQLLRRHQQKGGFISLNQDVIHKMMSRFSTINLFLSKNENMLLILFLI